MAEDNAKIKISFCPELEIYHYLSNDGTEYFFDQEKLLQTVETYISQKQFDQAEFMGRVTAWSRNYPHKIIVLSSDGSYKIEDPVKTC